jgi:hypothetical protein
MWLLASGKICVSAGWYAWGIGCGLVGVADPEILSGSGADGKGGIIVDAHKF